MIAENTPQIFTVIFQIAEAREPDEYAKRAYDNEALQDLLLGGPDAAGVFEADFERKAASFQSAVLSSLRDLERVFPEATVLRVEPDDLVTIAAIAERVGRSHESVRLLARNKRGPGNFPAPAGNLDAKTQVWRWSEVTQWFADHLEPVPAGDHAPFLAAINDILDLRRVSGDAIDRPGTAKEMASLLPTQLADAVRSAA